MAVTSKAEEVRKEIARLAQSARSANELMQAITRTLHERMLKYNWVGFYLLDKSAGDPGTLVLGAFQGAMTPHTRIPLNQGICGAAASTGKTLVIDDVNKDPRYLACSTETKSEIVAPVFLKDEVIGELDIDSHFPAAFDSEDRELVEFCAGLVGSHLEKSSK
jgi:GAF domain-containing protein